jgi:hypothetical protein
MNRTATNISLGLIFVSSVTIYVAQEARIRILKKQLRKSAGLGLGVTRLLKNAVNGMTEEQAKVWLEDWYVDSKFEDIVSNQK